MREIDRQETQTRERDGKMDERETDGRERDGWMRPSGDKSMGVNESRSTRHIGECLLPRGQLWPRHQDRQCWWAVRAVAGGGALVGTEGVSGIQDKGTSMWDMGEMCM